MSDINETLKERGAAYGDFTNHGIIAQQLKTTLRSGPGWNKADAHTREALDMISHKLARIVNGDPGHKDSWHDIIGYAKLVEDRL